MCLQLAFMCNMWNLQLMRVARENEVKPNQLMNSSVVTCCPKPWLQQLLMQLYIVAWHFDLMHAITV